MTQDDYCVLDSEEIGRLFRVGWSKRQLAARFGASPQGIASVLRDDRTWFSDPTLRARWEAKLPGMKAALREEIG